MEKEVCEQCGKALPAKPITGEKGGKTHKFCSTSCHDEFLGICEFC